eukprot:scaffold7407_cov131-Isochrysis_galbana.AAC.6
MSLGEIGRALERGENRILLEGLADVLGARDPNFVALKTVKVKQGAPTTCQPLLTRKRAHFGIGASPMCWEPSAPISLPRRLRGPNKEQSQPSAPADNNASAMP